ncbi:penicillin-binding protein 1A [Hyphomicrobium nitrativorans]|uniref:penicillin-binding protein 1A n=1 Tax=Hyphomicrobium nitrativorans TaxID=1427356 RepID=UPI000686D051|nr:penicillin-binding protein 1A [Hyphomicrobium nitrativorans]
MRAPTLPPPPQRAPRARPQRRKSLLLSFLGWSFGAFVVLFLVGSAGAGYVLWQVSKDLPDYESLAKYEPPVMTRIHAHDGSLIAEYARERRIFVPINAIPKHVIAAFLSAEDKRFYEHGGLDLQSIGRAVFRLIETQIQGGGRRAEGASTITQQVAKNFLLSSDRTMERKLKEAILAIRIERAYSKDKILELYLNEIYLGIGAYGVAAASLAYFSKELKDLSVEEVAYLAALPKAPNNYHPFRQTQRATDRRNWVIGQMAENKYITDAEATEARAKPLTVNIRPSGAHIFAAEYFAEEVRRSLLSAYGEAKLYAGGLSVRTTLEPRLQRIGRKALTKGLVDFDRSRGWRGAVTKIEVEGDWGVPLGAVDMPSDIAPWRLGVVLSMEKAKAVVGLRPQRKQDGSLTPERHAVELTLAEMKWAKVKGAEPKTISDTLSVGDVIYVAPKDEDDLAGAWSLMQIPEVGGGLIALDPHTGRVLAVVGGFSFSMSQFDRALQARRQPGSAFKPFVYAAAIDNGYKPTSIVLDAPIEIEQGPGLDIWRPENYERDTVAEPLTLRVGVEKSRNQMTVRLAQDLGMPIITEYSRRFGIYDDLMPVLSMSLGAGETTLLRLATAYGMLANGGKAIRPTLIDRIQDRWGKSVWRHDARECVGCSAEAWNGQAEPDVPDDRPQIIDAYTAFQTTSIMEGVIQRGTATSLKALNRPLAGKTGTTNEAKDAWFVGYSPDLVVGVFIGFDSPRPMGRTSTGGRLAVPIFGDFMKEALADQPAIPFRNPPGIKLVRTNLKTGLRASPDDPSAIMEAFKPDEEPDDAYSVIGFSDPYAQSAAGAPPPRSSGAQQQGWQTSPQMPGYGGGPGGMW